MVESQYLADYTMMRGTAAHEEQTRECPCSLKSQDSYQFVAVDAPLGAVPHADVYDYGPATRDGVPFDQDELGAAEALNDYAGLRLPDRNTPCAYLYSSKSICKMWSLVPTTASDEQLYHD